jgi:hypothetical protein
MTTAAQMKELAEQTVDVVRGFVARQLASRDERIALLEARITRLERERDEPLRAVK